MFWIRHILYPISSVLQILNNMILFSLFVMEDNVMSLFFRAFLAVGFAALLFSSFDVDALKNYNSSISNTSPMYPINSGDCEAAGGTTMIKGTDGFCIMEINTVGLGTLDHPSPRNCIAVGGVIETKGGKQYCMPTERELSSILVAPAMIRDVNVERLK